MGWRRVCWDEDEGGVRDGGGQGGEEATADTYRYRLSRSGVEG
jgi:hypothetical protein